MKMFKITCIETQEELVIEEEFARFFFNQALENRTAHLFDIEELK